MAETQTGKLSFLKLSELIGKKLAIFCCCAVSNTAYRPEIANEETDWASYQKSVTGAFPDGETNIAVVLGEESSQEERWLKEWGTGDEKHPYTMQDWRRLDELFTIMTGQLDDLGGLDPQQVDTARVCAHMALRREKLIASSRKEDIDMAVKLDKMIRENLSDCNMRKKDVLVSQVQRPDGFVEAMKKRWGKGADLTMDDAMSIFHDWLKDRNYPQTMDAAEHEILAILRTMQKNDGEMEMTELPSFATLDEYSGEFASEPNEAEDEVYQYLGISRGTTRGNPAEKE